MKYGTVYLTSKCSVHGTDWHQGNICVTAAGVHVDEHFYPHVRVERVSYR